MVRINLTDYNEESVDRPLNFKNIGNLTSPINGDYVSVIRFSIPASGIPLYHFETDFTNTFTLTYQSQSYTQAMLLEDRGSGNWIYEVNHLVSMMNTTLLNAWTGLNNLITLPTTIPPQVVYDKLNSVFSIIVPFAYDTTGLSPIYIDMNRTMWRFLVGLPNIRNSLTNSYRLMISQGQLGENIYLTTYIKMTQEAPTTSNWFNVRFVYITTSLPIESEIFTSTSINTAQMNANILASYVIPVENGTLDNFTSLNFISPHDRFRPCKITGKDLYNIKCDIYYQDVRGNQQSFYIGAKSIANIELEFY